MGLKYITRLFEKTQPFENYLPTRENPDLLENKIPRLLLDCGELCPFNVKSDRNSDFNIVFSRNWLVENDTNHNYLAYH